MFYTGGPSMFSPGARIMTRNGTLGKIMRRLTNYPPYQYLVVTLDGKPRILFHADLRLMPAVAWWPKPDSAWNGVERRASQRRQRRPRREVDNRGGEPPSDRRVADRRQSDRR